MPDTTTNTLDPIARIETMDAGALQQYLVDISPNEETVLRLYLGNDAFRRLRDLAFMATMGGKTQRDAIVILPSVLGTVLGIQHDQHGYEPIWLSAPAIARGDLDALRLTRGDAGSGPPIVHGIMKRYYGELMLTLLLRWNVHAFSYDWRQDLRSSAEQLETQLRRWFGYTFTRQPAAPDRPRVHLVAHGAGGLVARAFVQLFPERWQALGGKLVLLGVPNRGSLTALQNLCGASPIVRELAEIDSRHDLRKLMQIIASFPSFYQMLPTRAALGDLDLFDPAIYHRLPEVALQDDLLADGREFATWLASGEGQAAERMVCVLGSNQLTVTAVRDREHLDEPAAYDAGLDGDGLASFALARLPGVDTWYFNGHYADLVGHPAAIKAIEGLLRDQTPSGLTREPKAPRLTLEEATEQSNERRERKSEQFEKLRRAVILPHRGDNRSFTTEQRELEILLVRDVLSSPRVEARSSQVGALFDPPEIEIRLVCGDIARIDTQAWDVPVDAIAVGSYMGVRPQSSLKDLDVAVSWAMSGRKVRAWHPGDYELFFTELVARGALRPDLGQVFVFDDPRQADGPGPRRSVVVAGMGQVGRFGAPELAILVRELCWMVGRMGKRHLMAVPIGGGSGAMSMTELAQAWVRGIKYAITGVGEGELGASLRRVTLVEEDPGKIAEIDRTLRDERARLSAENRMLIDYPGVSAEEVKAWQARRRRQPSGAHPADDEQAPVRLNVIRDGNMYRFGAVTAGAAIPERTLALDPRLVEEVNARLAELADHEDQIEYGQLLGRLIIPDDIQAGFLVDAPIVMQVDATTARLHWEMMVPPGGAGRRLAGAAADPGERESGVADDGERQSDVADDEERDEAETRFLGLARGLTRQLQTGFAPLPEAPASPRRKLRALVIADTSQENRLPGAMEEGLLVANLLESFNIVYADTDQCIEVRRLFGPLDATRVRVLAEMVNRSYDIVHFAGHCFFDAQDPGACGWIFSNNEILSARELSRVDHMAGFVFSNACESGVTPERTGKDWNGMAPSFAEVFFARGVSNFLCTAWPVADKAAQVFAVSLYQGLLGLEPGPGAASGGSRWDAIAEGCVSASPLYMFEAVRNARRALLAPGLSGGRSTWGAYQHYGNPYFRFFDPRWLTPRPAG